MDGEEEANDAVPASPSMPGVHKVSRVHTPPTTKPRNSNQSNIALQAVVARLVLDFTVVDIRLY